MMVFNNQQQTGYEEIVSYGPRFYLQIKEMDAIYRFAGWTVDCMAADLEQMIALQFIMNMSAEQLVFYEQLFKIDPDNFSLDERRRQVYTFIYGDGKISGSKISALIKVIYGDDAVAVVNVVMGERLEIRILVTSAPDAAHMQLVNYLNRFLPAHVKYSIVYEKYMEGNIYHGALWHDCEIFELRQVIL